MSLNLRMCTLSMDIYLWCRDLCVFSIYVQSDNVACNAWTLTRSPVIVNIVTVFYLGEKQPSDFFVRGTMHGLLLILIQEIVWTIKCFFKKNLEDPEGLKCFDDKRQYWFSSFRW